MISPVLPAPQSSRGLEQSKTLRVFDNHGAARSVLDCGSPLPLSLADAGGRSEICWQRTEAAAPTGLGNFWFGFLQRCRAYGAGKTAAFSWPSSATLSDYYCTRT